MEKVNGLLCKIISKQVKDNAKTWDKPLHVVLWAYKISFKTSLGFTPFYLVHGKEALIPIEVELVALHVIQQRKATQKEENEMRILKLEQLQFHRDEAIEYSARQA